MVKEVIERYVPITQENYNKLLSEGKIKNDVLYCVPEDKIWISVLQELQEIKEIVKGIKK